MADTSDEFFSTFGSPPTKTAGKPPPPPVRPVAAVAGTSAAGAASYQAATSLPPPPPRRRVSAASAGGAARPAAARPAASEATTTTSGGYYGGAASTAPMATTTTTTTTSNAPYYNSASAVPAPAPYGYGVAAPSAVPAPATYGNYAAAPAVQAPAAAAAYGNYAAPAAGQTAAPAAAIYGNNYGAAPAVVVPQAMNPYMLSTPAADPAMMMSGTMDNNATFSGRMDTSAQQLQQQPSTFIPQLSSSATTTAPHSRLPYDASEFADDLPLLEELGVNVEHIVAKMRSVVLPFSRFKGTISDATVIQDADLAGPIALALALGGELMLSGKLQFGYIYGFGLFGCVSMTLVLNFMSPHEAISVWTVTSILGYSLLPVNLLAALKLVVVNLGNLQLLGQCLGILTVVWCTVASTRLMEQGCGMRDQRYLIAYPIGLLYTAFVMITIF